MVMIGKDSFHLNELRATKVFYNGLINFSEVYLLRPIDSQRTHPSLILEGQPVVAFFQFMPVYETTPDIDSLLDAKEPTPVLTVCGFMVDNEDFFHQLDEDSHKMLHSQVSNELFCRRVLFNVEN